MRAIESRTRGRGRPRLLTKEAVLEAAARIVRREGLDALSMPRLGRELGTAPMTVYGYVESKQDLLDDLADLMLADVPPVVSDPDLPWRDRVADVFRTYRVHLMRHPELARLLATQPVVPRASFVRIRAALEFLDEAGFTPDDAADAYLTLFTYTLGFVLWEVSRLQHPRPGAFKRTVLGELDRTGERSPLVVHLVDRVAEEPEHRFRFGLERILDGLEPRRRQP